MQDLERAAVVVVGGGVIGCAIAYHLCRSGMHDVLVLERQDLATGATARSAGCLSHSRTDRDVLRMILQTRQDIAALEEQLSEGLDFHAAGCIRAVFDDSRERELRRAEAVLASEGQVVHVIDAGEARVLCPWLDLRDARRIVHIPADGYLDGARLAHAYARAARSLGARIRRGVDVSGVLRDGEEVCGVRTDRGEVRAAVVIDAAGAWSARLAASAGVAYPAVPTRSHYWITAAHSAFPSTQPNVQLPDTGAYFRAEVGGLVVGVREAESRTYDPDTLGADMAAMPLDEGERDTDLLLDRATALRRIIPSIDEWPFAHHIAGLSMYTPDGRFGIGEIAHGLLVAGGCCGSGVAAAGGFGAAIAGLVGGFATALNLERFRPDRFGVVDPRSAAFRAMCSRARLGKGTGTITAAPAAYGA
jgi:4-methylaminobutanoate oxidase (formaldehyde-forming)